MENREDRRREVCKVLEGKDMDVWKGDFLLGYMLVPIYREREGEREREREREERERDKREPSPHS